MGSQKVTRVWLTLLHMGNLWRVSWGGILWFEMKSETESHSVLSESLWPHGLLQARILEWVAVPFSMVLCNPGIEPRSPTLQMDASPAEPPGKPTMIWPKNPEGSGGEGRGGSGWGTHVNPWLIHVNAW